MVLDIMGHPVKQYFLIRSKILYKLIYFLQKRSTTMNINIDAKCKLFIHILGLKPSYDKRLFYKISLLL